MKYQTFFIIALLLFTAFAQDVEAAFGALPGGKGELERKVCIARYCCFLLNLFISYDVKSRVLVVFNADEQFGHLQSRRQIIDHRPLVRFPPIHILYRHCQSCIFRFWGYFKCCIVYHSRTV